MNTKQKWIVIAVAVIISVMCIYPPFVMIIGRTPRTPDLYNYEYGFIWNPPAWEEMKNANPQITVNMTRLLVQIAPLFILGGIAIWFYKKPS